MEEGETKTCQNCKREIPAANFTIHSVHCTRNVRLCPVCKEPVLMVDMERHDEKQHKQMPCRQCAENVSASDMEDHIRDSCDFTIRSCRFCELELTRKDMLLHENYCGTRTEQCPDCREWVMLKYRQLHLDSNHGFLRLDDDPAPNNISKRITFSFNRPPSLHNGRVNRLQRNGLVRNINLLQDDMLRRMHMHVPSPTGAPGFPNQDDHYTEGFSFLPPVRGPMYSRQQMFDFLPNPQRISRKNMKEANAKSNAAVKAEKNMLANRGAVKKRAAPKPPFGKASSPTSPTVAKSGGQAAETSPDQAVDFDGPSTSAASSASSASSASARASTSQAKPNEPAKKSPKTSENVKKVLNKVADEQQRKKIQPVNAGQEAGPSNRLNKPQDQQPKAKVDNFRSFKPMTPEEFMNRVKVIQTEKISIENEEAGSVKEDRFSDIKHSLKVLRRELNEMTAPLNNNVNTNNNIIENDGDNGMRDLEALVLSSSEEEEGAAGGGESDGDEAADDVRLPCEFCGAPVLAEELVQHQTGCRPDLARYSPSQRRVTDPVIPCEFCTRPLPVYLLSEHQEHCGREAHLLFPD